MSKGRREQERMDTKKMWSSDIREYNEDAGREDILPFVTTGMESEGVMLGDTNPNEKHEY